MLSAAPPNRITTIQDESRHVADRRKAVKPVKAAFSASHHSHGADIPPAGQRARTEMGES